MKELAYDYLKDEIIETHLECLIGRITQKEALHILGGVIDRIFYNDTSEKIKASNFTIKIILDIK